MNSNIEQLVDWACRIDVSAEPDLHDALASIPAERVATVSSRLILALQDKRESLASDSNKDAEPDAGLNPDMLVVDAKLRVVYMSRQQRWGG